MNENSRWDYINSLDEEMLVGGATMSEWCAFIVREYDTAFVAGANLAVIITAISAIEAYLRAEYSIGRNPRLVELIDEAPIDPELKSELHWLRKYRNKWVHISSPADDQAVLDRPEIYELELDEWAKIALRAVRRTIYENQWV